MFIFGIVNSSKLLIEKTSNQRIVKKSTVIAKLLTKHKLNSDK